MTNRQFMKKMFCARCFPRLHNFFATARLAKPVRKKVKALMSLLVYAKSEQEYEDAKGAMLEKIGDVIKDTFTIDELVSTLITLQEYTEEQYIAEYNRRVCTETRLGGARTGYRPDADYTVNIGSAATATVTSGRTASTYEVDTAVRCAFMKTCLLPCRHVMFVRSKCNYETVIPPMHFFSTRLIVHSPVNNITEGEVSPDKALSSSSKYIDAKALAEKIVDRIALQSTPTYRVALQWLQDFYEARNAGTWWASHNARTHSSPGFHRSLLLEQ
ncbi:hypothetical protein GQ600_4606 [Phytophthora cactorum]|nr:hypothetical protein GQ600_4606 [Phytophthora cactorum]